MVKTADNITVTNGRLKNALKNQITPLVMPSVTKKIEKAVTQSQIQTGVMTKFYPYLDKCEVNLRDGSTVICRILHRFGGELIDFFTPLGTEETYCENLKEPCIIPRSGLNVCVLDINDGTNEQIMIGYFLSEDLIDIEPAEEGNAKITTITGVNEYWLCFGVGGFDIRTPKNPKTVVGGLIDGITEVKYADSNDTYTKAEIDKMIEDLRNEIIGEDDADDIESGY